jgi:hypothetical protein
LRDDGATGPSGGAGNKNFWIGHKRRSGVIFCSWYDNVPSSNELLVRARTIASENVGNQKN